MSMTKTSHANGIHIKLKEHKTWRKKRLFPLMVLLTNLASASVSHVTHTSSDVLLSKQKKKRVMLMVCSWLIVSMRCSPGCSVLQTFPASIVGMKGVRAQRESNVT